MKAEWEEERITTHIDDMTTVVIWVDLKTLETTRSELNNWNDLTNGFQLIPFHSISGASNTGDHSSPKSVWNAERIVVYNAIHLSLSGLPAQRSNPSMGTWSEGLRASAGWTGGTVPVQLRRALAGVDIQWLAAGWLVYCTQRLQGPTHLVRHTAAVRLRAWSVVFSLLCLRRCQTNDKVGRLLWAWFSCPTKSADKIGEPWHTADIFVCYFVRYQLAQQPNADRKIILASLFFCI